LEYKAFKEHREHKASRDNQVYLALQAHKENLELLALEEYKVYREKQALKD